MTSPTSECVIFRAEQLLPELWQAFPAQGPVRTFNPGLLRDGDGWIFAARIVGPDGLRRIALCRLTRDLRIVDGSQTAWSDHVRFRAGVVYPEVATRWFADPRLYRFAGRCYIYWNSGWHEPYNCQFVQEFDPVTLLPLGHPRELVLRSGRQKLEKNWTFFETEDGNLRAVYSILPHSIHTFSLVGDADPIFEEEARTDWMSPGYPRSHGGLRGGAPPVLAEGRFWSFCHSVHDGPDGYRYLPAVYSFDAKAPFAPLAGPVRPLEFGARFGSTRKYERLNPAVADVIYPCGAAREGSRWLVSHGVNDEFCAISMVEHADVVASLRSPDADKIPA